MKDFWDYFKSLFQKAEESSAFNPYIHELIERSDDFKSAHEAWRYSPACRKLFTWVETQYGLWLALPDDIDEAIDFLNTPSSKGFVIYLNKTAIPQQDAVHFFDLLKERVQMLNYKVQISDARTWVQKSGVEKVERHHLKPRSFRTEDAKFDQRFGNITIELSLRNDAPHQLKFRATSYNDHLYSKAGSFADLIQAIQE